ncbi:MAG: hypothetical protein IPJ19_15625 [Planctomycetes bacterium]|nr:hypothetical protein [Planctomycetota bacterium]
MLALSIGFVCVLGLIFVARLLFMCLSVCCWLFVPVFDLSSARATPEAVASALALGVTILNSPAFGISECFLAARLAAEKRHSSGICFSSASSSSPPRVNCSSPHPRSGCHSDVCSEYAG